MSRRKSTPIFKFVSLAQKDRAASCLKGQRPAWIIREPDLPGPDRQQDRSSSRSGNRTAAAADQLSPIYTREPGAGSIVPNCIIRTKLSPGRIARAAEAAARQRQQHGRGGSRSTESERIARAAEAATARRQQRPQQRQQQRQHTGRSPDRPLMEETQKS